MHGGKKRSYILKQTCSFLQLKVPGFLKCVRLLLLPPGIKGSKRKMECVIFFIMMH